MPHTDIKTRKFDPGVKDFIQYFDQERVMERAWDEDRKRHCIDLLHKPEREQIIDEIGRCQDDFEYTCRNYFEIVDEKGVEMPFILRPSQMLVLEKIHDLKSEGKQVKLLIIKARRLGCSALIESRAAHRTMFKLNQYAEIISYNGEHAKYLFDMLLHILDHLPWWLKPMVASRKEEEGLVFDNPDQNDRRFNPGLQSKIIVEAVTQVRGVGGQGKRVSYCHASEWCDWADDRAKTLIIEDLTPALGEDPEAEAYLESTAKGAGRFSHKFWRKNVSLKENAEWYPLFMPWFFEKNRVLSIPAPRGEGSKLWTPTTKEVAMRDRAMRDWLKCTDVTCDEYRESAIYTELFDMPCPRCHKGKMLPVYLTDEQLRWMWNRRVNAEDDEEQRKLLKQEFCATSEEAFQISGYQVFSDDILEFVNSTVKEPEAEGDFDSKGNFHGVRDRKTRKCYQPWCSIDHTYDDKPLKIWKFPEPEKAYVAGVDVSEGLGGQSDYSVIFMNKVAQWAGQFDEQVATYRNNEIDPLPFSAVCNWIGRWYNEAMMSVEVNKFDTVLSQLRQTWLYPNIFRWKHVDSTNMMSNKWGWMTQRDSKPRLWQFGKKWLKDQIWLIYSSNLLEEMKTFQKESPEDRGANAEEGMHDDEIIAALIALYTAHDMDSGDDVTYSTALKVNQGPGIEARGSWTASCTRCMAPAWQVDNPQYSRCPACGCRVIKAVPNNRAKPVVEIDFAEMGRNPEEEDGMSKTSFEYESRY